MPNPRRYYPSHQRMRVFSFHNWLSSTDRSLALDTDYIVLKPLGLHRKGGAADADQQRYGSALDPDAHSQRR